MLISELGGKTALIERFPSVSRFDAKPEYTGTGALIFTAQKNKNVIDLFKFCKESKKKKRNS